MTAWALAKASGAKLVSNVADLWPEAIVEAGVMDKDSLATRTLEKLELWLYGNSDLITAQSDGFIEKIHARSPGIPTALYPNGVDLNVFVAGPPDEALRDRFDLKGRFVVGYAGVLGIAQGMSQIIDAAELILAISGLITDVDGRRLNLVVPVAFSSIAA